MFYAVGSTRAAHGARAPRPRCCRRGGGVLARDAVDDSGRRTRLSKRSSRTLGAPHLAGVSGEHRVARAIGSRSRRSTRCSSRCAGAATRTSTMASSRAPRSSCTNRPASIRSKPSSPQRTLRDFGCMPGSTSTWCRARSICLFARDHLVNRHPEWLMVPREIAQDVAKVAGRQPCLRREARPLDTRADRRARRPLRLADRPGRRRLPSDRRARPATALRRRWRPFRLRSISERQVRLQPARARRVPDARSGLASIHARRQQLDAREKVDLFAYADALPRRLACVPRRPDDGADAPSCERR